jgi:hypothetical protein
MENHPANQRRLLKRTGSVIGRPVRIVLEASMPSEEKLREEGAQLWEELVTDLAKTMLRAAKAVDDDGFGHVYKMAKVAFMRAQHQYREEQRKSAPLTEDQFRAEMVLATKKCRSEKELKRWVYDNIHPAPESIRKIIGEAFVEDAVARRRYGDAEMDKEDRENFESAQSLFSMVDDSKLRPMTKEEEKREMDPRIPHGVFEQAELLAGQRKLALGARRRVAHRVHHHVAQRDDRLHRVPAAPQERAHPRSCDGLPSH